MKRLGLLVFFALACPLVAAAQEMVVTGIVTTREDGLPLPGATVSIASLSLSAVTDRLGPLRPQPPPGDAPRQAARAAGELRRPAAQAAVLQADGRDRPAGFRARPHVLGGDHGRIPHDRTGGRRSGAGGRPHLPADRGDRRHGDDAGDPAPGTLVQLPAHHDRGRLGVGASREPARAGTGPGAGADQRQTTAHDRPRPRERHDGARLHGRGPERDPRVRDRAHRDPARRGGRTVRLGRDRGGHQHRAEGGQGPRAAGPPGRDGRDRPGRRRGHDLGRRAVRRRPSPRASASATAGSSSLASTGTATARTGRAATRATRSRRETRRATPCPSPTTGWATPRPRTT